jgi:hypothetical protein
VASVPSIALRHLINGNSAILARSPQMAPPVLSRHQETHDVQGWCAHMLDGALCCLTWICRHK